jgi:serine/threonine protein kinase
MSELGFGSYRTVAEIGSGAISAIYRAVQEPLGRTVAVKALKEQIPATSSFGEQFVSEAKILADLTHPNIVLLLDAGRSDTGRPYVVLEWIDGISLEQLLVPNKDARSWRERGPLRALPVPTALAIAWNITAALEHVHERGVVHRDVKPANVLLSKRGHVKLIDFGIAQRPRTTRDDDPSEGITASGRRAPEPIKDAFGTPAYMSPEQILGDFVDARSDLFSLGIVLYQMLSGTRPFDAETSPGTRSPAASRLRRDAPVPLRDRAPECPRAVERIVMRLLESSAEDRYPNASVVRERLEHALRAETRDDPAFVVRAALADAGVAPSSDARPETGPKRTQSEAGQTHTPLSLKRALLGFLPITAVFAATASLLEVKSSDAYAARSAGAHALELAPEEAGGLRVLATPWAEVRVDGELVDTTPFARTIPLRAGKHFVTLSHPEATHDIERAIDVIRGETVTLDIAMNLLPEDAGPPRGAR